MALALPAVPTIQKTTMGDFAISPLFLKTIGDLGAIEFIGSKSGCVALRGAIFAKISVRGPPPCSKKSIPRRPLSIVRVFRFPPRAICLPGKRGGIYSPALHSPGGKRCGIILLRALPVSPIFHRLYLLSWGEVIVSVDSRCYHNSSLHMYLEISP